MSDRPKDITLYKFLNASDAPHVLGGSLKLGSLSKYRLMEALTGDGWIGDRQEGIAITHRTEEFRDGYRGYNNRYIRHIEGYLFCASHGDIGRLRQSMMVDAPISYDGCIEIVSGYTLFELIKAAPYLNGSVADYFTVGAAPCRYEEIPPIHMGGPGANVRPNPFLKSLRYASQSEFRIFLQPRDEVPRHDDLFLTIEVPDGLFRLQPPGNLGPRMANPFEMEREAAIAELTNVMDIWDAGPGRLNSGDGGEEELHEQLLPQLCRAYGALRFTHDLRSLMLDTVLVAPPPHPSMIYNGLRWFLQDARAGRSSD
jgi:hypothetical protein